MELCIQVQGLVHVCLNGTCEAGTKAVWFEIDLIQYYVLGLITPIAHFILKVFWRLPGSDWQALNEQDIKPCWVQQKRSTASCVWARVVNITQSYTVWCFLCATGGLATGISAGDLQKISIKSTNLYFGGSKWQRQQLPTWAVAMNSAPLCQQGTAATQGKHQENQALCY